MPTRSLLIARRPLDPRTIPLRHRLSPFSTVCSSCAALHFIEERTNSSIPAPSFSLCCRKGEVKLALPSDPPEPLLSLFTAVDDPCMFLSPFLADLLSLIVSVSFFDNIRAYNNAFSFSSLGVDLDWSIMGTPGIYTFRIVGQLCHRIGSLLPSPDNLHSFSQIYLHTTDAEQIDRRMSLFSEDCLDPIIVRALQSMMRIHNPYYSIWKTARERLQQYDYRFVSITIRTIDAPNSHDHRRYNHPTADEIAVVMPGAGDNVKAGPRDIIIDERNTGKLVRISELHPSYLPLRFPLLLPRGEYGWHIHLYSVTGYCR